MDPVAIAQHATEILAPALPFIYARRDVVVDKVKDMLLEKGIEKIGSKTIDRAKALLDKIKSKRRESLEIVLDEVSKNSEDPKVKEELQQEILKLLMENPDLAKEIDFIINLNIENVNNLALGNYNNFFNFETPSGDELIKIIEYLDQKRKEVINQEILSHYNPSNLPYYPEKLKQFVTKNRADELRRALTYLEKHRILLLSGIGGVGKSTLARALIDLRPINIPEPFWFSFYDNQDAKLGDILEKFAAYMHAPEIAYFKAERREPGKIDVDKLTDELHRRSEVWLIFDDLSMVLEDQQFADKGIEILFSSLRFNTHNVKVIITSRILPIFENGGRLLDVVEDEEKQHLNGLKTDFAVDYLIRSGLDKIEPKKLEELATGVDGHPLALKLLVELVKEYGAADILEDLSIYQEQKADTIKKARRLFDKLAGNEKELLERISVYREPVSIKGLKEMFTENTSKNAVKKLIDKSLLETNHNRSYWLHPLAQEFSYEDLKNKAEVHLIAYNYYSSLLLPKNPVRKEDLQPVIEAHYHACEAEDYDLAAYIIEEFDLHDRLDLWGYPRILIEIYGKLLPENHFKDKPIIKNKKVHGVVLGNLGTIYIRLGDTRKAIEYYKQGLKITKEVDDRHGERNHLGNLGSAYILLGDARIAIEYYEQALKISKYIGDKRVEGCYIGNLGSAYNRLGETRKAIEYHEQALKIHREVRDKRGEGNALGNLGLAYKDLDELWKAIEYYEQALVIAKEIGDRHGEAGRLGNLGSAYISLGEVRKAIEYCEQSLKISKEIGDRRGEGADLGNLGNAYSNLGEPRKAIEYYEKALEIAKEIGDKLGEGIWFGNLGEAYNERGETKKAIEFFKESLSIGKSIEDPRIISYCQQKLKELEGSDE
jgi:tetratricopeptide (TPR) repeat protein